MKQADQRHILEEILTTSTDLDEINSRLSLIIRTIDLKPSSLYLFDIDAQKYYIESNPNNMHKYRNNPKVIELSKTEYFKATLPDWGVSIINSLDE